MTATQQSTQTVTVTPGPDIQAALSQFYLNTDQSYSFVWGYLVNGFNQAKMAKWEYYAWVDTTLEEKYGHLVPVDEKAVVFKGVGQIYGPDLSWNRKYLEVQMGTRSTGNITWSEKYLPEIGRKVDVVRGELVFRDK